MTLSTEGNNMSKVNAELGKEVHAYLVSKGIETPMVNVSMDEQDKIAYIESKMTDVMTALGLDLKDDSLIETPKRIAKMYVQELFYGLDYNKFPKATTVENKMNYDEMVIERCTIKSVCEHHFVYFGTAHNTEKLGCYVAYMPKDKVLGLSKINRIVDFFARRPQIQERLTAQIAYALEYILGTEDIAVVMKSQHFCVLTRGVQDADSNCTTSYVGGRFRQDPALKAELMSFLNK
jgi:GTP cyclohydrolase I